MPGLPLLLTLLWTLLVYCHTQTEAGGPDWAAVTRQGGANTSQASLLNCPFMAETESSSGRVMEVVAYMVPICAVLLCNTVFLVWIMAVVISKLRNRDITHPSQYTQSVNLRAAKAFIVIVPLLGITYLVTIVGPSQPDSPLATIFIITRNVLLSFQGFFITLPYCFLSGEVCTIIRTHWGRWRDAKEIQTGAQSARNSIAMQGMHSVCDTHSRKRSYTYHVVRGSLVDRRGTQETEVSHLTTCKVTFT